MSREERTQQYWAQGRLNRSDQPFTDANLQNIGTIGDVVIEHPNGKKTVTASAMEAFLAQVKYRGGSPTRKKVTRLFSVPNDQSNGSDEEHSKTK